MKKEYDLNRFIVAQDNLYPLALIEIKSGKKETHWIWFVFPQLKKLSEDEASEYFGIEDIEEAKAYLAESVLRERLVEISEALLSLETDDPLEVMNSEIDVRKLQSSMTLFAEIEGNDSVFGKVINKYYDGIKDMDTLRFLYDEI